MGTQLEKQHQIDRHLVAWANKNAPSLLMRYVIGLFLVLTAFAPFDFNPGAVMFTRSVLTGEFVGAGAPAIATIVGVVSQFNFSIVK